MLSGVVERLACNLPPQPGQVPADAIVSFHEPGDPDSIGTGKCRGRSCVMPIPIAHSACLFVERTIGHRATRALTVHYPHAHRPPPHAPRRPHSSSAHPLTHTSCATMCEAQAHHLPLTSRSSSLPTCPNAPALLRPLTPILTQTITQCKHHMGQTLRSTEMSTPCPASGSGADKMRRAGRNWPRRSLAWRLARYRMASDRLGLTRARWRRALTVGARLAFGERGSDARRSRLPRQCEVRGATWCEGTTIRQAR